MKVYQVFLLLFLVVWACASKKLFDAPHTQIAQGIAGQVIWLEGNLMPRIVEEGDTTQSLNQGKPAERNICIYELTHRNQTVQENGFYKEVFTKLVKKIASDREGNFAVPLDTGHYSLFVEEPQGLFANHYDGEGHIHPVKVEQGKVTQVTLKVDYKAAY